MLRPALLVVYSFLNTRTFGLIQFYLEVLCYQLEASAWAERDISFGSAPSFINELHHQLEVYIRAKSEPPSHCFEDDHTHPPQLAHLAGLDSYRFPAI